MATIKIMPNLKVSLCLKKKTLKTTNYIYLMKNK